MRMTTNRRLWFGLGALFVKSFSVLLWGGGEIHRVMPPIPGTVVTPDGKTVFTRDDIEKGRQVWQSIGGQQLGSIWGHGSYVAPDWSADWLHREALAWLDFDAQREYSQPYATLPADSKVVLAERLKPRIRENTYSAASDSITVTTDRAAAIAAVQQHYVALFGDDPALHTLRVAYAMKEGTVTDPDNRKALTAFIWWSSWAAVTQRPGKDITYTN